MYMLHRVSSYRVTHKEGNFSDDLKLLKLSEFKGALILV